ncbi:MAG: type II secretion system F family protein, partial [Kiritimatiellia bacterium]|nr:type II secretion system F family protein [Kiritimatiellia bacterium]
MAVFKSTSQSTPASEPVRQAMPQTPEQKSPSSRMTAEKPVQKQSSTTGGRVIGAKKIRAKELPPFSRQLSAMLLAGMPLIQTLAALQDQTSDKNFQNVIAGLKNHLQGGASFSEALQNYPTIFDQLYVNMIKAGESGGQLGETAGRLAGFLESSAKLNRKVKSAMSYPVVVLCIALAIAIAMILFIVPVFSGMFADFGAQLPGPTQFLVNLSGMLRKYGLFVLALLVVVIIIFKKWKQTPTGAYQLSLFVLKFPIIGELNQKVATSRFARTFAQLLKSGVPILRAMEIVSQATGSKVFEAAIMDASNTVERGEPLSSALIKYKCFPKLLVHMMAAGEKTGKIDEMMQNIADFYDDEVEVMLDGLTSLIEPLLMI